MQIVKTSLRLLNQLFCCLIGARPQGRVDKSWKLVPLSGVLPSPMHWSHSYWHFSHFSALLSHSHSLPPGNSGHAEFPSCLCCMEYLVLGFSRNHTCRLCKGDLQTWGRLFHHAMIGKKTKTTSQNLIQHKNAFLCIICIAVALYWEKKHIVGYFYLCMSSVNTPVSKVKKTLEAKKRAGLAESF